MLKAKANSKRATDSMMKLAETASKGRRQGKCSESVSPAVESVTDCGPSSAEAVPGTSTHAT
ncbi:hypothetical protein DPMN_008357 [Dreissena polymorpha]|uniref:Uncharacterized protein n=1 Tax=Dreissena polymorpha TaxID=45954 RepID=A0A9D4MZ47_DREPO|nr:hypothetical protein DPMN_008357 [Dreissena polymorpha]